MMVERRIEVGFRQGEELRVDLNDDALLQPIPSALSRTELVSSS